MTSRITAMLCATAAAATAAAAFIMPAPAGAEDTVKLAYIDPLSGGGASIGEVGLKTFNYLAEVTNAKGGILGKKLEIVPYDNKLNAQESLVQVQKAIDSGIRFITQGNGSAFAAAIEDFVAKYNDRNPGKEVLYFNYAAVDPVLTNDKCSYWHFRWDANSDIKMTALTNYMKTRTNIKKLYLINQDYSFGQAVRAEARKMIGAKRPDIEIVGDEVHPLLKVTDFSPYIAKIKASGADSVITGNWGQDFALLLKAAADAGLQVDWYTYYAGGTGGPTAVKQANLPDRVFAIAEGVANEPYAPAREFEKAFRAKVVIVSPSLLMIAIHVIQQIQKDQRMREAASRIQAEVGHLIDDVRRMSERVAKLKQHFGQANEDVRQIAISTEKIEQRGDRIKDVDFEEDGVGNIIPAPIPRLQAGE